MWAIFDDTQICAVIPRPLSCPQVIESLNQDLAAINSWCLTEGSKKTECLVGSRSRTIALCYGDLLLSVAELEELKVCVFLGQH